MRPRHVLAFALLAAAGAARAQGVDLNVITAVSVRDQGASVVLTVRGSRPPNFTTFSMADPPRFVIDLSEAKFQGVAEDIPVDDGTIIVVKNLSYGSDSTSISRIMVAFAVDVDPPDVQAVGNDLVVRVDKPAAAGAAVARADPAAREAERAQAEARARAEAELRAQQEAEARARAEVEAELRAEAEARAREEAAAAAARRDVEAQARADADRRAREEEARRAAEAQARADAERRVGEQAEARAETERQAADRARLEEERLARAETERQRQESVATARADAERRRQEEADRREAEKRSRDEARAAAEAEKRQRAEEAKAAREAERIAREDEKARRAEEARAAKEAERQRKEEERLARAAAREEAERARAGEDRLSAGAPAAQLREVGFQQMPGASRVFVRTSVTPEFTIRDVGDDTVRIEMRNTRVSRRNDTRFLDTSFFPSAVAMVSPSRRGDDYVLDIKLKQRVPYQQKVEGDMLAIDFERPAAPAAERQPQDEGAAEKLLDSAPVEEETTPER